MWPTTSTSFLLMAAAILACSQWAAAASRNDWEGFDLNSSASAFVSFMSERGGGGPKCTTHKYCAKKGGECVAAGTCNTITIKAKCKNRDEDNCICCAKDKKARCKSSDKCDQKDGFCVTNKKACAKGQLLKGQCKCKGKRGHCCIAQDKKPRCKSSDKCDQKDGFCVTNKKACANGQLLKGQCKCKGKIGHCCIAPVNCQNWGYEGSSCGPDKWEKMYPACGGSMQSPIDFTEADISEVAEINEATKFVFTGYDTSPTDITIKNNGRTASITWNSESPASVQGGFLDGEYKLADIHFHWNSEHKDHGESAPMELQLVHYKDAYGDFNTATKFADGIAVLSVFAYIVSAPNSKFSPIIDALSSVIKPNKCLPQS